MQEVFEKIIEKLEDIPVLGIFPTEVLQDAIKVVEQVAEEYNNGWIPVEERLPKTPKGYEDCYWCTLKSEKYNETVCKIVRYARFANGNFWQLSREDSYIEGYKIIAWQPLPDLYQPKGDKE